MKFWHSNKIFDMKYEWKSIKRQNQQLLNRTNEVQNSSYLSCCFEKLWFHFLLSLFDSFFGTFAFFLVLFLFTHCFAKNLGKVKNFKILFVVFRSRCILKGCDSMRSEIPLYMKWKVWIFAQHLQFRKIYFVVLELLEYSFWL